MKFIIIDCTRFALLIRLDYQISNPLELDGPIEWLAYQSLYPKEGDVLVKEEGKDKCALDHPMIKEHLRRYPSMHLSLNHLSDEGYVTFEFFFYMLDHGVMPYMNIGFLMNFLDIPTKW